MAARQNDFSVETVNAAELQREPPYWATSQSKWLMDVRFLIGGLLSGLLPLL